jgi:hypothetical protein
MLVRPHELKTVPQAVPSGSHTVLARRELFVTTYFPFYALWISINVRLRIGAAHLNSSSIQTRTLAGSAAPGSLHFSLRVFTTIH